MKANQIRFAGSLKQSGLSLVELLIAMVLGLIVISAVFNTYLGSSRSSRFSEGLQHMQENGRYGVSALQKGIRLAGYSPNSTISPFDIAASSDTTVVVQMQRAFDCNGQSTVPMAGIAINTYQLDAANEQITCTGNSAMASAMPIVEGVEAFRVLYGIDDDGDDTPEQYVAYDVSIDADTITSVRFALLVNSGQPIRTRNINETYVVLDTEVSRNDRVARDVFSSTVKLRNNRR